MKITPAADYEELHELPQMAFTYIKMPLANTCVLILVGALILQYALTMYFITMSARLKCFNKEYMIQFAEEHAKAFPERPKVPQFGYPDSGYGWYGRRLPYLEWIKMNSGQRAQLNMFEQLSYMVVTSLLAAWYYPWISFGFLMAYFLGKVWYSIGYTCCGPMWRIPGALINDLVFVAQFILAVVSASVALYNDW